METFTKANGRTIWRMAMAALLITKDQHQMVRGLMIYNMDSAKKLGRTGLLSSKASTFRVKKAVEVATNGQMAVFTRETFRIACSTGMAFTTSRSPKRHMKASLPKTSLRAKANLRLKTADNTQETLKQGKKTVKALWCRLTETNTSARGRMTRCMESAFSTTLRMRPRNRGPGKRVSARLGLVNPSRQVARTTNS